MNHPECAACRSWPPSGNFRKRYETAGRAQATLTSAVTATVLLSLGHQGVRVNAEHRLLATLPGGTIALCVARVAPHRPVAAVAEVEADRVGS